METIITHNIEVSVETMYQPVYSKPLAHEYVHAYRITIKNLGLDTVQLLRRHWYIWDSNGIFREVEGEGVVGKQPVIESNESHQYVSGCPLRTDMGRMYGTFLMKKTTTDEEFTVDIPSFQLIPPYKNN
ncbi:MAG: Co2+/Mg2+ efflux protein ApaG [Saprospiraceae bacterium]|nr:Co2+/Mg2+ efflux protein ApaG [Saprospiraceae bacterium]